MAGVFDEIIERVRQNPKLIVADDYELALHSQRTTVKKFENGFHREKQTTSNLWVSLRVLHRKQPGIAVITEPDAQSIQQLVDKAFASSRLSSPNPWFRFPLWRGSPPAPHKKEMENDDCGSLIAERSGIACQVHETHAFDEVNFEILRRSERAKLAFSKTLHHFSFQVVAEKDHRPIVLKEEHTQRRPFQKEAAKRLGRALKLAEAMSHAEMFSQKKKSALLLSPAVAAELVKKIVPWFFFNQIAVGKSPLSKSEMRPTFARKLTLVDDGSCLDFAYSDPCDAEGVSPQKTVLVKDGEITGALFDTQMAARENRLSTGNYRRVGLSPLPTIAATTAYFEPESENFSGLMKHMHTGLALESVQSIVWQDSTRCALSGCGWWVEKGEPDYPIAGLKITLDINSLLPRAVAVGKDLVIFDHFGSPSILFEEMPLQN